MPSPVPRPAPPTSPSFRTWFHAQPVAVTSFTGEVVARRSLQPELGHDHGDLLQEVLMICYGHDQILVPGPAWEGRYRGFAGTLALNVIRGWHRHSIRRPPIGLGGVDDDQSQQPELAAPDGDPTVACMAREETERIARWTRETIARIPEGRPRTVLILQLRGWSNHRISAFLGENLETVNSVWSSRGRAQFRDHWVGPDGDPGPELGASS